MNKVGKIARADSMITFCIVFSLAAIFLLGVGAFCFVATVQSQNYIETEATVQKTLYVTPDEDNDSYTVEITYMVGGREYVNQLTLSTEPAPGTKVTVKYNPDDPEQIGSGDYLMAIILLILGAACVVAVVVRIKKHKSNAATAKVTESDYQAKVAAGDTDYEPNGEYKYYFGFDKSFAKQGHYMDDENRNAVCEARVQNFTLLSAQKVLFVNHLTGKEELHMIGHTVQTGGTISDYSYFKYDGVNVWDYLTQQGIRCEFAPDFKRTIGMKITFTRYGKPYADAYTSGANLHEDDNHGKLGTLLPAPGLFRVVAYSDDVDLLFLALVAFARTR